MTKAEIMANEWLMKQFNLSQDQVVKTKSPDFTTPVGKFEVKSLVGNTIIFSPYQPQLFDNHSDISVLVFNAQGFVLQIPGEIIKARQKEYQGIRIHYEQEPVISFRLQPAQFEQMDIVCKRFKWSYGEFFTQSFNVLIAYWKKVFEDEGRPWEVEEE